MELGWLDGIDAAFDRRLPRQLGSSWISGPSILSSLQSLHSFSKISFHLESFQNDFLSLLVMFYVTL